MNLFKQVATYFRKAEATLPGEVKPSANSIEFIVTEILEEPPSEDFQLLGSPRDHKEEEQDPQEVV